MTRRYGWRAGRARVVHSLLLWLVAFFLLSRASILRSQPSPGWHVLDLAGTNSYVEFPGQAFTNLTAATIEGWVKWRRFDYFSRFFDFGGEDEYMAVSHRQLGGDLEFELWTRDRPRTDEIGRASCR